MALVKYGVSISKNSFSSKKLRNTRTELSDYQKELDSKLNPVVKAKAKVAKLAKAKTVKVKAPKAETKEETLEASRLQKIVDESIDMDEDVEDFNQILRENGIEV